jgi:hypothetical protein
VGRSLDADLGEVCDAELVIGWALCGALGPIPATGATVHRRWNDHPGRRCGIFFDAVAPREGGARGGGVGETPTGVGGGDAAMVGQASGAAGGALPPPRRSRKRTGQTLAVAHSLAAVVPVVDLASNDDEDVKPVVKKEGGGGGNSSGGRRYGGGGLYGRDGSICY